MIRVLLISILCTLSLFTEVDERQSDVYLATGIFTSQRATENSLKDLKKIIYNKNPAIFDHNQAFKSAYNTSNTVWDLTEALSQLLTQEWPGYWDSFLYDIDEKC